MSASSSDKQLKELRDAITSGSVARAYHFFGADDFRKDEALRQLLAAAVDPATRDFNLDVRHGAELSAEALGSLLATPPMMAARRAVVLRDPDALKKETRMVLDSWCKAPPADVMLVLVSAAAAKADKSLPETLVPVEFALLEGDKIGLWIAKQARALGAEIEPAAAALLVGAVGNDPPALAAELDKLASYSNGVRIDEAAVAAVVGIRRGETMGDLLDAVGAKEAATALALVEHVLSQPKATAVLLVIALATQTLAMAWGRAKVDAGMAPGRLSGEYFNLLKAGGAFPGRAWGEATSAWTANTMRWTREELDRALDALLAADVALKSTTVSQDAQVVTTLILTMCAGARARSAA